jgi:hypothetical protein
MLDQNTFEVLATEVVKKSDRGTLILIPIPSSCLGSNAA